MSQLAIAKTKILLGTPEKRLHASSHRVQLDGIARWHVNLVRDGVLHTQFAAFIGISSFTFRNGGRPLIDPFLGEAADEVLLEQYHDYE